MNPEQAARERDALDRALSILKSSGSDDIVVAPLADLSRAAAARLRLAWPELDNDIRMRAVRAMVTDSEQQFERSYERALAVAIDDVDADVRLLAWNGLWEDDSTNLLYLLLERIDAEQDDRVRASMAEALGTWSTLVELEEIDEHDAVVVRERLLALIQHDPSATVRQRALESAGFISSDVDIIHEIERAFDADDGDWRVAALRAMGRQATSRWREHISGELSNEEPELRYVAAQAAGESADQAHLSMLIDLIDDDDSEVQRAAITSIGAIGGGMAVRTLRRLLQADSPAIVEAAQEALDEALLTAGELHSGPMFDPGALDDQP